jgi:hypothetical protein
VPFNHRICQSPVEVSRCAKTQVYRDCPLRAREGLRLRRGRSSARNGSDRRSSAPSR